MPKDNRKILGSVRMTGKPIFKDGMEDELAAELDQKRIEELKSEGVLVGDWKSMKNGGGVKITGDAPSRGLAARMTEENLKVIGNQDDDFEPLSVEETMKRFQEFDFSDEVMRSMQFHKEAIKSNVGSTADNDSENENSQNTGSGDSSNGNSNESDDEFPAEFPSRAKFIKADKTFAQVKEMNREQLIAIDGIAEKTADEVIAYLAK